MVFRRENLKNKVKVSLTSEHWDFANLVDPGLCRMTLCAAASPALFAKDFVCHVLVLETKLFAEEEEHVDHPFFLQKMNYMKIFLSCLFRHHW